MHLMRLTLQLLHLKGKMLVLARQFPQHLRTQGRSGLGSVNYTYAVDTRFRFSGATLCRRWFTGSRCGRREPFVGGSLPISCACACARVCVWLPTECLSWAGAAKFPRKTIDLIGARGWLFQEHVASSQRHSYSTDQLNGGGSLAECMKGRSFRRCRDGRTRDGHEAGSFL